MKNKRVFIVHGWDGSPQGCWIPWLKSKLETKGFFVVTPIMPDPEEPKIQPWVSCLGGAVGRAGKNDIFVGHSIGCQAILRYVEQLPFKKQIGGIVCVAGFFKLPYLETEEEKEIAKPWIEKKIDFEKIKNHTNRIVAIFSDNDPDVDIEDKKFFIWILFRISIFGFRVSFLKVIFRF